ncbi:hypothetical protein HZS_91 [Henneguya salminicola]|nr:hypothetical protein HZS_91 [Henneguya salminicola]
MWKRITFCLTNLIIMACSFVLLVFSSCQLWFYCNACPNYMYLINESQFLISYLIIIILGYLFALKWVFIKNREISITARRLFMAILVITFHLWLFYYLIYREKLSSNFLKYLYEQWSGCHNFELHLCKQFRMFEHRFKCVGFNYSLPTLNWTGINSGLKVTQNGETNLCMNVIERYHGAMINYRFYCLIAICILTVNNFVDIIKIPCLIFEIDQCIKQFKKRQTDQDREEIYYTSSASE